MTAILFAAIVFVVAMMVWGLLDAVLAATSSVSHAVYRRNFFSYFSSPIGYLFICIFIVASNYLAFIHENAFFASNLADLDPLNQFMPYLLLLFVPAVTMSIWAEERGSGTEELLMTLPASDWAVVLGKYVAALSIFTVSLGFTAASQTWALERLGEPDLGLLFTTYLGYWLMGAALIATGMVASVLTGNVTVAFILGTVFCALLVLVGELARFASGNLRDYLESFGIGQQFQPFGRGLVALGGVVYYAAIVAIMLYLNLILLGRRDWEGGRGSSLRWSHYALRTCAYALVASSLTILVANAGRDVDVTEEQIYNLSADTEEIVAEIPDDRTVFVEAYVSPDPPQEMLETQKNLVDLLRRYDSIGGGKVVATIHETEAGTETARDAEALYDIVPLQMGTVRDGQQVTADVFLGLAFKSGLETVTIPFFYPGWSVEYELSRAIRTVSLQTKRKIGIVSNEVPLFASFDFQRRSSQPSWPIVDELEQQYDVAQVSPDEPIEEAYDCLIVPMPSLLTQPQLDNVTAYVRQNRPVLLIDDPLPGVAPDLAPQAPKPPPGGQMGGMFGGQQPSAPKGGLSRLLSLVDLRFDTTKIVYQDYNPLQEYGSRLGREYVFIGPGSGNEGAFNPNSAIASGLKNVLTYLPGYVTEIRPDGGPEMTPLMSTGPLTGYRLYGDMVQSNPLMGPSINPDARPYGTNSTYVVAALVTGDFRDRNAKPVAAEPKPPSPDGAADADSGKPAEEQPAVPEEGKVIFVADLDMIAPNIFNLRRQASKTLRFDNVAFILNAVDSLVGDVSFVDLRKKSPKRRTLTQVEEIIAGNKADALARENQAREDAEETLNLARAKLQKKVDAVSQRTDLSPRDKRAQVEYLADLEQRRFEVENQRIDELRRDKIREIQEDLTRQTRTVQNRYKLQVMLLPPIPVLLLAIGVFFARRVGETEGVTSDRLV